MNLKKTLNDLIFISVKSVTYSEEDNEDKQFLHLS